jgi:endonuclease IV
MNKFGLKLWSKNIDFYLEEAKKLYQNKIYNYIELYVVPGTINTIEEWKTLDIPFIIHSPHFAHGFNLAKKEKAKSNLQIYKEVKAFADELKSEYIIFHGGIDGDIKETATQLKSFSEPRALIENKPYRALPNRMNGEFCRGYNRKEISYVIENVNCGFCLDFGHAVCSANSFKIDPYDYIEKLLKLTPQMFHLTDLEDIASEFDSHPHIGQGSLNINKILYLLPQDAIITVETNKNSKENLNDFMEDMRCLKNLL